MFDISWYATKEYFLQPVMYNSITMHRNAGIIGGKFLERTRAVKPRSHPDNPNYYMPQDFAIGSVIEVFKHKFIIIDADEYVLNYMEKRTSKFSPELIEALRNKHKTNNPPAP